MNTEKGKKDYELKRVLKNGTKTLQPYQQKMLDSVLYQIKSMQDKFVFDCLREIRPDFPMEKFLENPDIFKDYMEGIEVMTELDNNMYLTHFMVKNEKYKTLALNLSR